MTNCPNCGAANADTNKFCAVCGTSLNSDIQENPYSLYADPTPLPEESQKKRSPFKIILAIVLTVVLLAGAVIAAFQFLPFFKKKPNYALYFKDDELYYTGLGKIKPIEIAGDTTEDVDPITLPRLTDDGKYIVFIDDVENDSGSERGTLYLLEAKDPDAEPVKIKSDVEGFLIVPGDKYILYDANSALYQYNIKDGENNKIKNDATPYGSSEDGKYLIYYIDEEIETDDGYEWEETWYIKEYASDDVTKIADNVDAFTYLDRNFEKYCYISDDDLYIAGRKANKTKIDSDVDTIYAAYETGEIYYGIANESDNENEDDRYAHVVNSFTLYYYDGHSSTEVCDNVQGYNASAFSAKDAVAAFKVATEDEESNENTEDESHRIIVSKGKIKELDETDIYYIIIKPDGSEVYYLADCEYKEIEEEHKEYNYTRFESATLYKLEINKGNIGNARSYKEGVYSFSFINEKDYYYYTDYDIEEETADLYINDNFVDSDVTPEMLVYNNDSSYLYITNLDIEEECYTINLYNGKKSVKVSDDVVNLFGFTAKGDVLYITEWDDEDHCGELYVFNGKKSEMIDDEVTSVIPDFNYNIYISTYNQINMTHDIYEDYNF